MKSWNMRLNATSAGSARSPARAESIPARMTVLQVISAISTEYGGPSTAALGLHRALVEHDATSIIASTDFTPDEHRQPRVDQGPGTDGTNLHVFRGIGPARVKFSYGLLVKLPGLVRRADFVHIHGQFEFPVLWAFVLCVLFRTPFGVQLHGSLEPYDLSRRSRQVKKYYLTLVGKTKLQKASYVMCASESEASHAAVTVPKAAYIVIPLGYEKTPPLTPALPAESAEALTRHNQVNFLFLGRFARKKRPDLLLEAWAEAAFGDAAFLHLVGPDDAFSASELRAYADRLGVSDSVSVIGPMTRAESSYMYEQADIFVLPSENENFGLTIIEAMANNCFIVTTPEAAASEHVAAAGCGILVSNLSRHTLAVALLRAAESYVQAPGASDYVNKNLSWAQTGAELISEISRHVKQRV